MNFANIPLLNMISRRLDWLGERQQVLAENVANANTPGYRAQDLKPQSFEQMLRSGEGGSFKLAATDPRHIGGRPPRLAQAEPSREEGAPERLNGNDVVLENEMMKVSQTAMDYQLATNLYSKQVSMFRMAIGRTS